mmetsp:Transcript_13432/g.32011  ORF Transcript_13432/g.32011 Transcript_13432/m.32011 type:complete len:209 (+) Transcript_13432:767-1393(+)
MFGFLTLTPLQIHDTHQESLVLQLCIKAAGLFFNLRHYPGVIELAIDQLERLAVLVDLSLQLENLSPDARNGFRLLIHGVIGMLEVCLHRLELLVTLAHHLKGLLELRRVGRRRVKPLIEPSRRAPLLGHLSAHFRVEARERLAELRGLLLESDELLPHLLRDELIQQLGGLWRHHVPLPGGAVVGAWARGCIPLLRTGRLGGGRGDR